MKFSVQEFFSKYDQTCKKLRIWSHFLENSLMKYFFENFLFDRAVAICVTQLQMTKKKHT